MTNLNSRSTSEATSPSQKERSVCVAIVVAISFAVCQSAMAATHIVNVGLPNNPYLYQPSSLIIQPGDTVTWVWNFAENHSVTSGTFESPTDLFDSGLIHEAGASFSFTFPEAGTFPYHCSLHNHANFEIGSITVGAATPTPTPTPRPPSQAQLLNISTRMDVQTEDKVLIGGFIITGTDSKKILLRAIGPSLSDAGVVGTLADPVLELHGADGSLITSNDNWKETQQGEIEDTGVPPSNDLEAAIIATLAPANYTAIVSGKGGTTGVGLVEGYDLDQLADSQMANISTRGLVQTGSDVMIGGFILGNGSGTTNMLIRALGPSLADAGVTGALSDPTLELHDADGALVMANDNWKDSQEADIEATSLEPTNELESAMVVTVPTAGYTAIVTGQAGLTGVSLVEVYRLP